MRKVMFAIGNRDFEDHIRERLSKSYNFVGEVVSKESVLNKVRTVRPDILLLRENLMGKMNILEVVHNLVNEFDDVRIVFLASKREPGDVFLTQLVNYGVYDILHGESAKLGQVERLMSHPNKRSDVQYLQPIPLIDEKTKELLFDGSSVKSKEKVIIQERIKEVFVDSNNNQVIPEQQVKKIRKNQALDLEVLEVFEDEVVEDEIETNEEKAKEKPKPKPTPKPKQKPKLKEKTSEKNSILSMFKNSIPQKTNANVLNGRKQIITFSGARSGVGTSTMATTFAAHLAKSHSVLYVEVNDIQPSTMYWYQSSKTSFGIETLISDLLDSSGNNIEKNIMTHEDLFTLGDENMLKRYKKFPKQLDFLSFSKTYVNRMNHNFEELKELVQKNIRELYIYLDFQTDYDFIIVDVGSDYYDEKVFHGLTYSNKVFYVMNQDIVSIINTENTLHELKKNGLDISKKTVLLINKYDKNAGITSKEISEWVNIPSYHVFPNNIKNVYTASFNGLPLPVYTSDYRGLLKNLERELHI